MKNEPLLKRPDVGAATRIYFCAREDDRSHR